MTALRRPSEFSLSVTKRTLGELAPSHICIYISFEAGNDIRTQLHQAHWAAACRHTPPLLSSYYSQSLLGFVANLATPEETFALNFSRDVLSACCIPRLVDFLFIYLFFFEIANPCRDICRICQGNGYRSSGGSVWKPGGD